MAVKLIPFSKEAFQSSDVPVGSVITQIKPYYQDTDSNLHVILKAWKASNYTVAYIEYYNLGVQSATLSIEVYMTVTSFSPGFLVVEV